MANKVYNKIGTLNENHWKSEYYKQRLSVKDWKMVLLHNDDNLIFEGRNRKLIAKKLGFGVVEVSKEELK
jgi:hypothetical protein